jgi:signal transduction histidine kinase
MIEFVADAAKRLNAMISDLLNYSRLDAPTTPVLVDCEEVLSHTLDHLSAAIRESGAEILRGPMPALIAEPSKISQIFLNLLGNAIKFRGVDHPVIRVQAVEQPGSWLFSVQDNGIGIPPEHQERIMELFARVTPDQPGTGIGLTIAKKAAEQHGGQLWVQSAPGQGSTFYFTIAKGNLDGNSASY